MGVEAAEKELLPKYVDESTPAMPEFWNMPCTAPPTHRTHQCWSAQQYARNDVMAMHANERRAAAWVLSGLWAREGVGERLESLSLGGRDSPTCT